MNTNKLNKVEESFAEFLQSLEVTQTPDGVNLYGSNPDLDNEDQLKLPFEFENRPELGGPTSNIIIKLEAIQSIATAGINKYTNMGSNKQEAGAYIDRHLNEAYKHLKEAYLRLMDIK